MLRATILLVLLCFCPSAPAAGPGGASFGATSYDFGTVKQGAEVSHQFAATNSGNVAVVIQRVELSMPGMSARFKPVIAPGAAGTITLVWNTAHATGEMEGDAVVYFADPTLRPALLVMRGIVKPPIEILPFPAIFLSSFQGEPNERRLKIINNQEQATTLAVSQAPERHFQVSLTTLQSGRMYKLVAKIPASVPPGHYEEELLLSTSSPAVPRVTIPVHLFVKAELYANPDTIDFGRISAADVINPARNGFLTQTFLVRKRTGPFTITSFRSNVPALQIRKTPDSGSSSTYQFDVSLKPRMFRPGRIDGYIELDTTDRRFPHMRIAVRGELF